MLCGARSRHGLEAHAGAAPGASGTARVMPLHRERVDPIRTPVELEVCHRRWLLPDDPGRAVALPQVARFWRALLDLGVLDPGSEATLDRLPLPPAGGPEHTDLPAIASAGALLGTSSSAAAVSQVVFPDDGHRDPYLEEGPDTGYRDYTLYVVDSPRFLLAPLPPVEMICGACGDAVKPDLTPFGVAALVDLSRRCPACGSPLDIARDRARLRSGAVFLLEELCARASLSIELPHAPRAEELPDEEIATQLREVFGSFDELADDGVPPA